MNKIIKKKRQINDKSLANLRPVAKGEVRNPKGRPPGCASLTESAHRLYTREESDAVFASILACAKDRDHADWKWAIKTLAILGKDDFVTQAMAETPASGSGTFSFKMGDKDVNE